jgi:hypothetical protein
MNVQTSPPCYAAGLARAVLVDKPCTAQAPDNYL